MITGKELKRFINVIPDSALIMLDGNPDADIIGIKAETDQGGWVVNLKITAGFSVTKDSVINELFSCIKS